MRRDALTKNNNYINYKNKNGWNSLLPVRQDTKELMHDKTPDVAIIGAGYTGIGAAKRWHEIAPNDEIAIIDASTIGEGNPGRNSGFLLEISLANDATSKDMERMSKCNKLISETMTRIIDSVAPSKATAFIVGESGTGKELTASALHEVSKRKNEAFYAVNCAAIPRDLMESELFGHVRGAFTGATTHRDGAASMSDGGTLFLDEVCEMDLELQKKMLRFIQTGEYQRVGSNKVERADIRFVCASNKDPLVEVREGRFREDLFYRLHVVPIHLPPLRERGEDIIDIAEYFLNYLEKQITK